ncbi:hypothetical protein [Candidatus Berkiella aquae]|uniref:Uncharacterized protein n=1 Tax=Candidatus Berkiella aquae TaxID=295108 RepID=A0A0Q9YMN3_9GAMM|nr:hypothetical protein [Candidatus Berkiella aquae]MCS5711203.1 hypothetical protein [Candidatus Berkiella aquae]
MLLSPIFSRTFLSDNHHGNVAAIHYGSKEWLKVNSTIDWATQDNRQWISAGSSHKREHLLFDENSELIQDIKDYAVLKCRSSLTHDIPAILSIVNAVVNELTTEPNKTVREVEAELDNKLRDYILKQNTPTGEPIIITMDELIRNKLLVCRHKALLVASILGELVKRQILPPGIVRQYRSTLVNDAGKAIGAHTWAVFRDQKTNDLWICDPRARYVENVTTHQADVEERFYGRFVIERMMQRLNQLDVTEDKKPNDHFMGYFPRLVAHFNLMSIPAPSPLRRSEPPISFLQDNVHLEYRQIEAGNNRTTRFFKHIGKKCSSKAETRFHQLIRMSDLFKKLSNNTELPNSEKAKILYAYLQTIRMNIADENNTFYSSLAELCNYYINELCSFSLEIGDIGLFTEIELNIATRLEYNQQANDMISGKLIDINNMRFGGEVSMA